MQPQQRLEEDVSTFFCCVTALNKAGKKSGPCVRAGDSCAKERRFHDPLFEPYACRRMDSTYSFT